MIKIQNPHHFADVVRFAAQVGALDSLINAINGIDQWFDLDLNSPDVTATIIPDSPYEGEKSFRFFLKDEKKPQFVLMHGGIIYSGPGHPSDGSAPSLTVSLDPDASAGTTHKWSVHT